MTDEKKDESKDEFEKMNKRMQIAKCIGLIPILFGAVLVILAILNPSIQMIPDTEHITNQDLPVRDMKNATYTWTAAELKKMQDDAFSVICIGLAFIGIGAAIFYTGLFLEPGQKKMHKIICKSEGEKKYCSQCGLKLSRLEHE